MATENTRLPDGRYTLTTPGYYGERIRNDNLQTVPGSSVGSGNGMGFGDVGFGAASATTSAPSYGSGSSSSGGVLGFLCFVGLIGYFVNGWEGVIKGVGWCIAIMVAGLAICLAVGSLLLLLKAVVGVLRFVFSWRGLATGLIAVFLLGLIGFYIDRQSPQSPRQSLPSAQSDALKRYAQRQLARHHTHSLQSASNQPGGTTGRLASETKTDPNPIRVAP